MERATLIGIKTRVKVLIAAKQAARKRQLAQRIRAVQPQPQHPLLTVPGSEGVYVKCLNTGLALDLTQENAPDFPQALALLTTRDVSATEKYREVNAGFLAAVQSADVDRVKQLLAQSSAEDVPQVCCRFEFGWTALHHAAHLGHSAVLQVLLACGQPVDLEARSDHLQTPLLLATQSAHLDAMQTLLDAGANSNSSDEDLWSPLHFAVKSASLETAQLLLRHHADAYLRNKDGKTALELGGLLDESMASVETHDSWEETRQRAGSEGQSA